ncbi:MAG: uroporphyrinogen decarboxylase [Gemmataceae bacterium]|nr:uroporphyrinogen decarboxylase [Gemmataceae bacterium]
MKPLLVRAALGEKVERPPVWAMRQAGRWDPEFMRLRAGRGFYEFSEDASASAEASLLPRRFGVDGIILFYDITSLPVAMGQPFSLQPERGPVPEWAVRSRGDVERLAAEPDPSRYGHILDMLGIVRRELAGELPVLVFAGAPYTVASYCVGTGKDMAATKRFATENAAVWEALLDKLAGATVSFVKELVKHGAAAWQLFDSWAGELPEADYDRWAQPLHRQILAGATGVPRILFVKECPFLERLCDAGAEVVSLGKRHDLAAARAQWPHLVFQGNVDEELVARGTAAEVEAATRACVRAGGGQRHIVNLNHGMDRGAPVANFEAFVRAAKDG